MPKIQREVSEHVVSPSKPVLGAKSGGKVGD